MNARYHAQLFRNGSMLNNTFCHIKGIGQKSEKRLWNSGVMTWQDVLDSAERGSSSLITPALVSGVKESMSHLETDNARYFSRMLCATETWRIFSDFRHSVAYLDIETTGMAGTREEITTISVYDGVTIYYYIRGQNLERFARDIQKYRLLVTYNGKCFDLPVIRRLLHAPMDQAHIDLRYLLHSLGYRGGLKGCEKQLGIDRDELDGLDGYFAILLWQDYIRNKNGKALETLLAYNILDAVNLERLMVTAFNLKLQSTPFQRSHTIQTELIAPENPFQADMATVDRLRSRYLASYH